MAIIEGDSYKNKLKLEKLERRAEDIAKRLGPEFYAVRFAMICRRSPWHPPVLDFLFGRRYVANVFEDRVNVDSIEIAERVNSLGMGNVYLVADCAATDY